MAHCQLDNGARQLDRAQNCQPQSVRVVRTNSLREACSSSTGEARRRSTVDRSHTLRICAPQVHRTSGTNEPTRSQNSEAENESDPNCKQHTLVAAEL
jgi:hypothetical protein